jgi:hypothetical protein
MSDFGIGSFLSKVSGKIMNVANSDRKLKCESCDAITEHASISYAELTKQCDSIMADIQGINGDLTLGMPLVIGNPYVCVKCKKVRLEGGVLSNKFNKDSNLRL